MPKKIQNDYSHIISHFEKADQKILPYLKKVNFEEWINIDRVEHIKDLKQAYFISLCRSIIGQQLSGKVAQVIYQRFENLLKNKITPGNVLAIKDQQYRDVGLSWAKIKYIKDLALKVKNREINLEKLSQLPDEEVTLELIKVKGIGKWTTEMFLMFVLRRENIFSFGDLGLKKGYAKVYKTKDPSIKKITKTISKWHPYKTYGAIALWQSLEEK